MTTDTPDSEALTRRWTLPSAARLGSSVRSKGLYLEVRIKLPVAARKLLSIKADELTLAMPDASADEFAQAAAIVDKTLDGIESLPVIPREIEDILAIKTSERHRWLKDGRLPSAGTRTVKLRGRARKITFHVFDPRVVEDILNSDTIDAWREEDAERAAENRRQAAWKAKLARDAKKAPPAPKTGDEDDERFKLRGWAEFERESGLG
jgi:hypothetical protein